MAAHARVSGQRHVDPERGRLMTPREVAAHWRVTPDTVVLWILAGRLPAIRTPGGQHRIYEADALRVQKERDGRAS